MDHTFEDVTETFFYKMFIYYQNMCKVALNDNKNIEAEA